MNPENPKSPREELEARLTALLLGELSADEAAAVRRALAQDAQLAKLHDRLQTTIGLVREVTATQAGPTAEQPPLKLSEERRERLLGHFKTVPLPKLASAQKSKRSWLIPMSVAAALVVLLGIAVLLPGLSRSKSRDEFLTEGQPRSWFWSLVPALDNGVAEAPPPAPVTHSGLPEIGLAFRTWSSADAKTSREKFVQQRQAVSEFRKNDEAGAPATATRVPADSTASRRSRAAIVLPSGGKPESETLAKGLEIAAAKPDSWHFDAGLASARDFSTEVDSQAASRRDVSAVTRGFYDDQSPKDLFAPELPASRERLYETRGEAVARVRETVAVAGKPDATPPQSKLGRVAAPGVSAGGSYYGGFGLNSPAPASGLLAVAGTNRGVLNGRAESDGDKTVALGDAPEPGLRFYRNSGDVGGGRGGGGGGGQVQPAPAAIPPPVQMPATVSFGLAESKPSATVSAGIVAGRLAGGEQRKQAAVQPDPAAVPEGVRLAPPPEVQSLDVVGFHNMAVPAKPVQVEQLVEKVPVLGDVPLLGKLFRSEARGSENLVASANGLGRVATSYLNYGDFGESPARDNLRDGSVRIAGGSTVTAAGDAVVAGGTVRRQLSSIVLPPAETVMTWADYDDDGFMDLYVSALPPAETGMASGFERVKTEGLARAEILPARPLRTSSGAAPSESARLIQDGKVLLELGKTEAAEKKLNEVLKAEPGNRAAEYYLDLAKDTRRRQGVRKDGADTKTALASVERMSKPSLEAQGSALAEAKQQLDEALRARAVVNMEIASQKVDLDIPRTTIVEIVDKAPPARKTGGLAGLFTSDYASSARIRVDRDVSDIKGMADSSQSASYDPYFLQAEFEVIQSERILSNVVQGLGLQSKWGKESAGGQKLKAQEAMALLRGKLDLKPVKGTSLIEIRAKSEDPQEAANIANAVAETYRDYRLDQRRQLTRGSIEVLQARFQEHEKKVQQAQAEVDSLRKELTVVNQPATASTPTVEVDAPPVRKPSTNAPIPQPEVQTSDNAFSTFSLNVSDVAFKLAAASLEQGQMPDAASVRAEEFINAFDYRDPEPPLGVPVAFAWERARYPFAHNRDLLRFSLKTAAAGRQAGRPLNLVLLLDNSGSMERADRVQIIREALGVLAGQLQPQDKLSVITFARTPRLWVDGVTGDKAGEVPDQVGGLTPQGGTNLEEAMNLAYATALRHYLAGGINRVVLLTDGAANLGNVEPDSLKQKVESHRKQGVAFDCFGIGWEGFNDDLLEVLSRNGDGRYGFINSPDEAATEFAGQLAGALKVAASDVKVQVEFNPKRVTAYRQIGYAKHQLTKEQFRDNTVDAAEIAAQEAGNALYTVEVNPAGEGPLCTVRARFKIPGTADYREHEWAVPFTGNAVSLEQSSPAMRLAATASAFAEWLVVSPYAAEVTPDALLGYLNGVPEVYGADERPKKLEWMIRQAKSLTGK